MREPNLQCCCSANAFNLSLHLLIWEARCWTFASLWSFSCSQSLLPLSLSHCIQEGTVMQKFNSLINTLINRGWKHTMFLPFASSCCTRSARWKYKKAFDLLHSVQFASCCKDKGHWVTSYSVIFGLTLKCLPSLSADGYEEHSMDATDSQHYKGVRQLTF